MTIKVHHLSGLSARDRAALLQRTESDLEPYIEKVRPILAAVKSEGDGALVRFARLFDRAVVQADGLAATEEDFAGARRRLAPDVREAISFAADSIRRFHEKQRPQELWLHEIHPGAMVGERVSAIPSVACYVPRGKGSFPSSALMTCIPARVAGVPQIAIVTPPGPDGTLDDATLFAAEASGVTRVYKCGGAQAVAAVAYGTETVQRAVKIVGPGSPFVVAAKRLVAGLIDTGPPAGPSESVIFADETADGRIAALDLLIEAEHGPDSSAFLVTTSSAVAEAARTAIPAYLARMSEERAGYARTVLSSNRGGIVIARDIAEAADFINDYAPEHLEVLSTSALDLLAHFRHAGEILLGPHAPTTLGNFVLGPSHVLPTGGWAKTHSPLGVHDFMKRTSIAHVTRAGYEMLKGPAGVIARYEGFDAHANAVSALRDDGAVAQPPRK